MQRAGGGGAGRRGGLGSAPGARGPGARRRGAAGLGQPRPRARADAHTERPGQKREEAAARSRGQRGLLARPLLMARPDAGGGGLW